jgi:hypothetical protein
MAFLGITRGEKCEINFEKKWFKDTKRSLIYAFITACSKNFASSFFFLIKF